MGRLAPRLAVQCPGEGWAGETVLDAEGPRGPFPASQMQGVSRPKGLLHRPWPLWQSGLLAPGQSPGLRCLGAEGVWGRHSKQRARS